MKVVLALIVGALLGTIITWRLQPDTTVHSSEEEVSVVDSLLIAQKEIDRVPFRELVPQVTDRRQVLPLDNSSAHLIESIKTAAEATRLYLNDPNGPAPKQRRINEVSRFAEEQLKESLNAINGIHCEVPLNAAEKRSRSGYPDLMVTDTNSGRIAYLDPKLYEAGSEKSTLRTFYFQPKRETSKILHDAHHLLLGFRHDGNTGAWQIDKFKLVDLFDFQVGLKIEFQGSNRDLYREGLLVE